MRTCIANLVLTLPVGLLAGSAVAGSVGARASTQSVFKIQERALASEEPSGTNEEADYTPNVEKAQFKKAGSNRDEDRYLFADKIHYGFGIAVTGDKSGRASDVARTSDSFLFHMTSVAYEEYYKQLQQVFDAARITWESRTGVAPEGRDQESPDSRTLRPRADDAVGRHHVHRRDPRRYRLLQVPPASLPSDPYPGLLEFRKAIGRAMESGLRNIKVQITAPSLRHSKQVLLETVREDIRDELASFDDDGPEGSDEVLLTIITYLMHDTGVAHIPVVYHDLMRGGSALIVGDQPTFALSESIPGQPGFTEADIDRTNQYLASAGVNLDLHLRS